jgi:hypothetical protein
MKYPPRNLAIFLLLLLIGGWQLQQYWRQYLGNKWLPQTTLEVNTSSLIIEQLRQVSQLSTVILTTESLIPTKAERTWGSFVIGTTELVYLAQGEVRAGINLADLKADNLKQTATGLEILLPPPEILDSKIDVKRSQVYYYHRGFLALGPDLAPQLQTQAQRQALHSIIVVACQRGILHQANLETQAIVTELLQRAGHENVIVKTQEPAPRACNAKMIR